jgi:hypothetical protein
MQAVRRALTRSLPARAREQRHQDSRSSRRYESDVALYNETALNLAHKHGATINDLHRSVAAAGSDRLLGPDGVHFTENGCEFLAAAVVSPSAVAFAEIFLIGSVPVPVSGDKCSHAPGYASEI